MNAKICRVLMTDDVRDLCIKNNYFTRGTCETYEAFFEEVRRRNDVDECLDCDDYEYLARIICEHSDDANIRWVMSELLEISFSYFTEA